MRVTLLHNPGAGDDDHSAHALTSAIERAGHEVTYHSLGAGWREALANPGDLVVVAGGDGSVGKVFKEVATKDVAVTLLPMGSANNIARTLGIDDVAVEQLVAGWENGELRGFDLGRASAPWGETLFAESVGGGIFGEVLARAPGVEDAAGEPDGEEKVELGLELMRDVIEDAPVQQWGIEIDGERFTCELLAAEVMNIGELGPNFGLAPEVDPADGLLDVVRLDGDQRAQLLAYFSERMRDLDPDPPDLPTRRGRRILLEPPPHTRIHVDDRLWPEDAKGRPSGRIVVEPGPSLRLLIPHC